jgi:hypothetical protein
MASASLLLYASSSLLPKASSASHSCGSGVLVCWANVGKAKLIARPARASKRIFIFPPGV